MFIRSFVFPKKIFILILIILIIILLCFSYNPLLKIFNSNSSKKDISDVSNSITDENSISESETSEVEDTESDSDKDFIKWVDFNVTADALNKTANLDIKSHQNNEDIKYNWIELLAYLACKNGGNFKNFKSATLDDLVAKLKNGETIESLTSSMKFYDYYYESYSAVLDGFIGNYFIETANDGDSKTYEEKYGLKAFLPIAKNYSFSHYDDFGNSRSYGFKRTHLGNDLMGSIGTPIIAVESGIVENLGWNQYGGWRIGIRSLNSKRYYYKLYL